MHISIASGISGRENQDCYLTEDESIARFWERGGEGRGGEGRGGEGRGGEGRGGEGRGGEGRGGEGRGGEGRGRAAGFILKLE